MSKPKPLTVSQSKQGKNCISIPLHDVMYLQSDGDYVQVITKEGTHLKEQTMIFFET